MSEITRLGADVRCVLYLESDGCMRVIASLGEPRDSYSLNYVKCEKCIEWRIFSEIFVVVIIKVGDRSYNLIIKHNQ